MNINIKRDELTKKEIRKLKIKAIQQESSKIQIGYKWKCTPESDDESTEDLHLFCISIVRDLLGKKFYTNEKGVVTYDGMEDEYDETLADLNYLFQIISNKKLSEHSRR